MATPARRRSTGWRGALDKTIVVGPRTNAGFLAALCRAAGFPPASSTPASSTAISPRSAPRRRASIAPPPRSAREAAGARKRAHRRGERARAGRAGFTLGCGDAFQLSGARRSRCRSWPTAKASWRRSPTGPAARGRRRRHRARDPTRWRSTAGRCGLCAARRPPDQGLLARSHARRGWGSRARRACARAHAWQGAGGVGRAGRARQRAASVSPSSRR